jgi:hypothetical protein
MNPVFVSVKGRLVPAPSFAVQNRSVVVVGRVLRVAQLHEEDWIEAQAIADPDGFAAAVRAARVPADLLTFLQPLGTAWPATALHRETEDAAAVPLTTYAAWWSSLPQASRKNVRRAEKRGLVARVAAFDDALVAGIKAIYDEVPFRQGRRFWHYGKSLEQVRRDNATFLDRSEFVAAYLGDELVGFIKLVYVGRVARIMQILSKNAHADKRAPNLLLAKAVEVCCQRGLSHFVYGQYYYGNKGHTAITEFKRRNGFERLLLARCYVPLTPKGRLALTLRLHRGLKQVLPRRLINLLLRARARFHGQAPDGPAADSEAARDDSLRPA